uniref:LIM zinc-binding domain-containing protein n=1 Tax=Sexangularia sp. CB-2014 TaxID=1486929 RepID=A0A7S1VGQ9_9EUKA
MNLDEYDQLPTCHVCSKQIYPADRRKALKVYFHRWCFRCVVCKTSLTLGKECEHNGQPYCNKCHNATKAGVTGFGYGNLLNSHVPQQEVAPATVVDESVEAQPNDYFDRHASKEVAGPKFCPDCGAATTPTSRFCADCGAPLQ